MSKPTDKPTDTERAAWMQREKTYLQTLDIFNQALDEARQREAEMQEIIKLQGEMLQQLMR